MARYSAARCATAFTRARSMGASFPAARPSGKWCAECLKTNAFAALTLRCGVRPLSMRPPLASGRPPLDEKPPAQDERKLDAEMEASRSAAAGAARAVSSVILYTVSCTTFMPYFQNEIEENGCGHGCARCCTHCAALHCALGHTHTHDRFITKLYCSV